MNAPNDSITPTLVSSTIAASLKIAPLPLSGLRVLVVDDSQDNLFLFERLLKRNGAVVSLAEDGLEGVNLAMNNLFDVVLMDIQMPAMDGLTAMTNLKQAGYDRPVIALTAYTKAEDKNTLSDAGFAGHICKPIEKEAFIAAIRSLAVK